MKLISLTKDQFAIIDDDDFDRVNQFKWTYNPRGYAYKNIYPIIDGKKKRKVLYLHRFITNAPSDKYVDHKNRNSLDNRKENLRLCHQGQNQGNEGLAINNTSGYKGVTWAKNDQKWRAYIKVNYQQIHLGSFNIKEDAAKAYNEAAFKHFGEFARLNEI